MRIRIRGVVYSSVPEAANALGVSKSTIYTCLHRGTIDTVGLGGKSPNYKNRQPSREVPVVLFSGRLEFRNTREAAKALGYSQNALWKVVAGKTGARSRENLQLRAMHYMAKNSGET